ncbi:MAG: SH3 domain-containing protein [Lachnospiraceae bacterium]|nr:SH3 domain-containing protein [Lachnospiraceae bacterium]
MKRRIATIILLTFTATSLVACGNSANVAESTADTVIETEGSITEPTATPEETEAPHEHVFTETITKEATCLEAGEKTLACECGESSVEEVPATGHDFSNYVSNEDATYEANGTETATCACGETDTRIAENSMLTYSFEEMDATKYAKSTVNVRAIPISDGEKLGGLSANDEVKVTGKCNETGWYRIEYADGIAYVSDEYLVDEKVEVQVEAKASAPATSNLPTFATYAEAKAYVISLGYPIGSAVDNGDGTINAYAMDVVTNDGYWNFDYLSMYSGIREDLNESRWAADDLGCNSKEYPKYKNINIANCADGNNMWVVCIETYNKM